VFKRLAAGGVAAVVGLGVWGVAGEDHSTRDDTGSIVASGDVGAFVTKLGDCFESLPDESTISTIPGVPCNTAHHWQVFHKEDTSLTSYDKAALDADVEAICSAALEDLVYGLSDAKYQEYQESNSFYLFPTPESWDKGDRTIDCLQGSDTISYYSSLLN
jgi:hypothetical protein